MVSMPTHIRKIMITLFSLLLAAGVTVALAAAIRKSNASRCEKVDISIKGNERHFLAKADIWSMMGSSGPKDFTGKPVTSIDLRSLENKLRNNSWVKSAELYIDKEGVLQVTVTEREPIARLFTSLGSSFYIDSEGKYLPLGLGKPAMRLPVFTGMPEKIMVSKAADSSLLAGIKAIGQVLQTDSLWNAQIMQVDMLPDRNFDMVPMVGNHIIHFGNGENVTEKFQRLAIFYKKVLAKTGFDYYKSISVQYAGQVIGEKDQPISTFVDKKLYITTAATAPLPVNSSSRTTKK